MSVIFAIMVLFLSNITHSQDLSTPTKSITFALDSMIAGNFDNLLKVTEGTELKSTQKLIEAIKDKPKLKEEYVNEYKNLKSWEIDSVDEVKAKGRDIALVSIKWVVNITIEDNKTIINKTGKKEKIVRVNYLLERFKKDWKIIDRKSI